ncbi:Leucine carboxyl methyltransferase [Carpediemonas membranifera]|uniref:Leucine carboxyl methyltransferase n=1 Tax=Carpediemonas membranifera TaxID=201153 RepID=A0A8J6AW70_9EUKA|nr:Leucine carboxyl methyltransferase [Carpediemonas membranifera]|eukprot:KAG9396346.1 Leucine carboxyl methyltransferase [Carpediemonas membranifera]
MDKFGKTAQYIAYGRYLEHAKGDKALFQDPYAQAFAGDFGKEFMEAIATQVGTTVNILADYVAIRTKAFDNFAVEAVSAGGCRQVVVFGCGGDSRSHRLLEGVRVFNVDLPDVIDFRKTILEPRPQVIEVAADLASPETIWPTALTNGGFDASQPTLWILEGLLMYIPPTDQVRLLQAIETLSAPGSKVVGDVFNNAYMTAESGQPLLTEWSKWAAPPRTDAAIEEPETFFGRFGFDVEVKGYEHDDLNFGLISEEERAWWAEHPRVPGEEMPRNLHFFSR